MEKNKIIDTNLSVIYNRENELNKQKEALYLCKYTLKHRNNELIQGICHRQYNSSCTTDYLQLELKLGYFPLINEEDHCLYRYV